ncbi:MAG: hypothetical protein KDD47_21830, partial [Acidobacteria bacterium]|nr:hypothetical protein [Acidobacteriota bacterium]
MHPDVQRPSEGVFDMFLFRSGHRPLLRSRTRGLTAFLFLWLVTIGAQAQFPSQEPGYSSNAVFELGDLDDVNLFNGNLILSLPLGQSYGAGGGLSYAFTLRYNWNQAWEPRNAPHICVREFHGNDVDVPIDIYDPGATSLAPGWSLSFGSLEGPAQAPDVGEEWEYTSPDGAEHKFFANLHPPATPFGSAHYTADGTHLRLQSTPADCINRPASGRSGCTMRVELPDGSIHTFERQGTNPPPGGDSWRIVSITSPEGLNNSLTFNRQQPDTLEITDGFRTHYIHSQGGRITSIDLAAFNSNRAVYQFEYTPYTVDRHRYAWDWYQALCIDGTAPDDPPTLTVDLLTRIVQPDDSYYEMDYYTEDGGVSSDAAAAGIRTLRHWTGLFYEWKYTVKNFRYQQGPAHLQPRAASRAFGVSSKEVYAFVPGTTNKIDHGTWQYLLERAPAGVEAPLDRQGLNTTTEEPCYHKSTVIDPLGNRQVSYLLTADQGFTYQQNRPYTVCDPVTGTFQGDETTGEAGPGPFLSEELYDSAGTKLREVWVDYESDGVGSGSRFHHEQRLTYSGTVYLDDGGRIKETSYSDFDGLGHARQVVEDGDFPLGEGHREAFTRYNPARGSLDDGSFTPPPVSQPWVLGTYDLVDVSEGQPTAHFARSLFCFEAATGLLKGQRTLKADTEGAGDVLRRYFHDNRGQITSETLYGGDPQSLTAAGCGQNAASGLSPVQEVQHTYQFGSRRKSQVKDGSAVVLTTLDSDVDANTGR